MLSAEQRELREACARCALDKIESLLKQKVNPQFDFGNQYPKNYREMTDYKTPLGELLNNLYAEEHLEFVKKLIDAGADVNSFTDFTVIKGYSTLLGKALLADIKDFSLKQRAINFLLSQKADPNLLTDDELYKFMHLKCNSTLLTLLLRFGLNPNRLVKNQTLLHHVVNNLPEMAIILIDHGAAVTDEVDLNKKTLLQMTHNDNLANLLVEKNPSLLDSMSLENCAMLELPGIALQLIQRGHDINEINQAGYSPLMVAAMWGSSKMVFVLLEAGADMNIQNPFGETALHLAMSKAKNFSISSCDYTDSEYFSIIFELYSRGAFPVLDNKGRTPLMCYNYYNRSDALAIRFCINEFSCFESDYFSYNPIEYGKALYQDYEKGTFSACKELPIQENPRHLYEGIISKTQVPMILNQSKEELIAQAMKKIVIALTSNNEYALRSILQNFPEIDINTITDKHGHYALSIAIRSLPLAENNCIPILEVLLAHQANINLPDNTIEKETPLMACFNKECSGVKLQEIKFMLKHQANVNAVAEYNNTVLHKAAAISSPYSMGKCEEAIELLIAYGANIDAKNQHGKKPVDISISLQKFFQQFQPQKGNRIDQVLDIALSNDKKNIFAKALKANLGIEIDNTGISLVNLIDEITSRPDISLFTKSKIFFLKNLLENQEECKLDEQEFKLALILINELYEASVDIGSAVSNVSEGFKNIIKLNQINSAATTIQTFFRHYKNKAHFDLAANYKEPSPG